MLDGFVAGLDALPAWQATAVALAVSLGSAVCLELAGLRLARRLTRLVEARRHSRSMSTEVEGVYVTSCPR